MAPSTDMVRLHYDLHIHTCLSPCGDDDMTPGDICAMAALKGLDLIAVTDHNTALNLPAAAECAACSGLLFVPGIEISCRDEGGKYHILAYGYDPEALPLGNLARTCHEIRMNKVRRRLDFLKEQFGMTRGLRRKSRRRPRRFHA